MNEINYPIQLIGTLYDSSTVPYVKNHLNSSHIEHTFMNSAPIFIANIKSPQEYESLLSCPSLVQLEYDQSLPFL